jgi:DNA-binding transcriptional LysR family regulator
VAAQFAGRRTAPRLGDRQAGQRDEKHPKDPGWSHTCEESAYNRAGKRSGYHPQRHHPIDVPPEERRPMEMADARAGVGLALVSKRAIERDLASGQLTVIASDRTPIQRPLYLVHRGRDRLPPAASELHKLLVRQRPLPAAARS